VWMATVWHDVDVAGGWGRMMWQPDHVGGRGWLIPDRLALGDVIEVGARSASTDERWYGILDSYEVAAWLTLQGPYPNPAAAQQEADRLLAGERFRPAVSVDVDAPPTSRCSRRPRRRARHP